MLALLHAFAADDAWLADAGVGWAPRVGGLDDVSDRVGDELPVEVAVLLDEGLAIAGEGRAQPRVVVDDRVGPTAQKSAFKDLAAPWLASTRWSMQKSIAVSRP